MIFVSVFIWWFDFLFNDTLTLVDYLSQRHLCRRTLAGYSLTFICALTGTTIPGQSGTGSKNKEGILLIHQIIRTRASSYYKVWYPTHNTSF